MRVAIPHKLDRDEARRRIKGSAHEIVDVLPDREWAGTVESLSPASGSRFALLPPDNATGNFTRVVQRLPVRIRLTAADRRELGPLLAPGLSAKVRVRVVPAVAPATTTPGTLTQQ